MSVLDACANIINNHTLSQIFWGEGGKFGGGGEKFRGKSQGAPLCINPCKLLIG